MATKKKLLARILIRPPARPSDGAQTIRESLGVLARLSRMDPVKLQYRMVINWGNSAPITTLNRGCRVLNAPAALAKSVNKLLAFRALEQGGVVVPQFSTEKPVLGRKDIWLARHNLTGSGGAGITVVRAEDEVPDAPLYVRYVAKRQEFRVHVVGEDAIFAQLKKRRSTAEQDKDQKLIRNYNNGWVFCPVTLEETPEGVKDAAVAAVRTLGLDFGAVDLIIGNADGRAYTLEVNSAPGLESPGLIEAYTEAFNKLYRTVTDGN